MGAIDFNLQRAVALSGAEAARDEVADSKLDAIIGRLFPADPPTLVHVARLLRVAKYVYIKAYPETEAGKSQGAGERRRHDPNLAPNFVPRSRFTKFIADAAKKRNRKGWSATLIDERVRWAERIRPSVLKRIEGTKCDRRKYLDKLARTDRADQQGLLDKWLTRPTPVKHARADGWWSGMPGVIDMDDRFHVPGVIDLRLGDSRDILPTLVGEADAVITDNPYGIGYESALGLIEGDEDPEVIAGWSVPLMEAALKPDSFMILFGRWDVAPIWQRYLAEARCPQKAEVIWDKGRVNGLGATGTTLGSRHELVLVAHKGKPRLHPWTDEFGLTGRQDLVARDDDLWSIPVPRGAGLDAIHPTRKPVKLGMRLLLNFSPEGGLVLDPFMGCGPFAVAAIRTRRQYIGIELKPEFFAVAVQRAQEALAERGPCELSAAA